MAGVPGDSRGSSLLAQPGSGAKGGQQAAITARLCRAQLGKRPGHGGWGRDTGPQASTEARTQVQGPLDPERAGHLGGSEGPLPAGAEEAWMPAWAWLSLAATSSWTEGSRTGWLLLGRGPQTAARLPPGSAGRSQNEARSLLPESTGRTTGGRDSSRRTLPPAPAGRFFTE